MHDCSSDLANHETGPHKPVQGGPKVTGMCWRTSFVKFKVALPHVDASSGAIALNMCFVKKFWQDLLQEDQECPTIQKTGQNIQSTEVVPKIAFPKFDQTMSLICTRPRRKGVHQSPHIGVVFFQGSLIRE